MPPPRIPSGPIEPARSLSSTTQRERRYQTTVRPDPLTWARLAVGLPMSLPMAMPGHGRKSATRRGCSSVCAGRMASEPDDRAFNPYVPGSIPGRPTRSDLRLYRPERSNSDPVANGRIRSSHSPPSPLSLSSRRPTARASGSIDVVDISRSDSAGTENLGGEEGIVNDSGAVGVEDPPGCAHLHLDHLSA